jgi:hypothetical protein
MITKIRTSSKFSNHNYNHFLPPHEMSKRWGRQIVSLVEGDNILLKVPCPKGQVTPRSYYLIFPFLLENIHSKKLVLLIASEGKKWGLGGHHTRYRWEKVAISGGEKWGKVCRGDCAVANARLTF